VGLRSLLAVVPIANIAIAAREILTGAFDWPFIILSWCVTGTAALWTGRLGLRVLSTEKLITAAETDALEYTGGPALFERQVLRWFAMLWAALMLVNNYTQSLDVRWQVVINLVGLFFGASCLMIRRYRLNPREALALRAPRPLVWLGVLLAVPGGLLTALGVFRLSNFVLPVSEKVTETFSEGVIPANLPLWQLLICLTILPGIFEEIAFRGLLLHGLRRRFHPAVTALIVGVAFGLFHVALFRLVPTACLGVLFAAVTFLTGSIYPAMVWHCLNNLAGILAYRFRFPENELEVSSYLIGVAILAMAFWIFWRQRTPYPGVRWKRDRLE
jgi:membrane protease YdiL (CAAX protease family)